MSDAPVVPVPAAGEANGFAWFTLATTVLVPLLAVFLVSNGGWEVFATVPFLLLVGAFQFGFSWAVARGPQPLPRWMHPVLALNLAALGLSFLLSSGRGDGDGFMLIDNTGLLSSGQRDWLHHSFLRSESFGLGQLIYWLLSWIVLLLATWDRKRAARKAAAH